MPTKISQLPAATLPLAGAEQIELVQNANSRRVTVSDLSVAVGGYTPPSGGGLVGDSTQEALDELDLRYFNSQHFMTVTRHAGGASQISEHGTQSSSVGTADQPALVGTGTVFQATHRRGAISTAAINSGATFYDVAASAFARVSGTQRGAGFLATWRGGLSGVRADQKFIAGMIDSTAQILNAAEVPSNTLNCLCFGKDQGDANLQIMYNNAAGVCTKVDTGVVFTSFANILLEIRIFVPQGGGAARFTLINKETNAVLVNTSIPVADANYPAADALMYWHADVNTGTSIATAVRIYLSRLLIARAL